MTIEIEALLNQNITIVCDSLDLASVDSSKLKTLRGAASQAAIMDVPEMIVAVFPPEPLLVQIGDNRVRITLQGPHKLGSVPLWDYVFKCMKLVGLPRTRVIAYGFNYDAIAKVRTVPASDLLKQRVIGDAAVIEEKLGGQLQSISPRLRFVRTGVSYDLILEQLDDERIKSHLNAHFDVAKQGLPLPEKLKKEYLEQYRYFEEVVSRLLS